MAHRTAWIVACALGLGSGAWAQTEHKLEAREIFYAPAPAPQAPAKKTAVKQSPRKAPKKDVPASPQPVEQSAQPVRDAPHRPNELPVVNAAYTETMPLGVRYSILMKTGTEMNEVDPATVFHAGDRIRLRVEVNAPGYLYIVNRGSSGNWKPLFPAPEVGNGDNRVSPGRSYEIPPGFTFTFDEQAGEEKLFIVFSRKPAGDLESLIYSLGDKPAAAPKREEKPPLLLATARPIGDDLVSRMRNTYARDLIIEKVDQSTPGPKKEYAVYAVNPSGSQDSRVVADVSLNHK